MESLKTPITSVLEKSLNEIFLPNDLYTFLVGAGVSMNPPSCLPSAKQIIKDLLDLCAVQTEIEALYHHPRIRYELIVEHIQSVYDKDLEFLNYFDFVTAPNLIHGFIAQMITQGHYAVTTNFDYLIEFALMRLISSDCHKNIIPVITKEEFQDPVFQNPNLLVEQKKYPLYKIHGSKKNVITNTISTHTMVTTISTLGKDREEGETFAIETYKKPAMNNLMNNRTLVIMGYSGSDDFDIGPVLKELPYLRKLIWIEHANQHIEKSERYTIIKQEKIDLNAVQNPIQLLLEIANRNNFEVILIRGNTYSIISEIWNSFHPEQFSSMKLLFSASDPEKKSREFKEWASFMFKNATIKQKYFFTMMIYHSLGQFNDVIRVGENGLIEIPKLMPELKEDQLGGLHNLLGVAYSNIGQLEKSNKHYGIFLKIEEQGGDPEGIIAALSGIAVNLYHQSKFKEAIEITEKALKIAIDEKLEYKEANMLSNLGMIYRDIGQYDKAKECITKALKIAEKLGILEDKALRYALLGMIDKVKGDYESALKLYVESLKIYEQLGHLRGMATRSSNIGQIFYLQDNLDEAKKWFEKSLEYSKSIGDEPNQARMLGNLAVLHSRKKEYDKALEIYENILKMAEKANDIRAITTRLNNIGMVYQNQKMYEKSIEYFEKARNLDESAALLENLITDLNNIGVSLWKSGKIKEGLEKFEQSLKIVHQIGHKELEKSVIDNIRDSNEEFADILKKEDKYKEAAERNRIAYQIELERKSLDNQSFYLHRIGHCLYLAGDYEEAKKTYQISIDLNRERKNTRKLSDNLYWLGIIKFELNDYEGSLTAYKESIQLAEQLPDSAGDLALLHDKMVDVYFKMKKFNTGALHYRKSIDYSLKEDPGYNNIKKNLTKLKDLVNIYDQIKNPQNAKQMAEIGLSLATKINDLEMITQFKDLISKYSSSNTG